MDFSYAVQVWILASLSLPYSIYSLWYYKFMLQKGVSQMSCDECLLSCEPRVQAMEHMRINLFIKSVHDDKWCPANIHDYTNNSRLQQRCRVNIFTHDTAVLCFKAHAMKYQKPKVLSLYKSLYTWLTITVMPALTLP